MKRSAIALAALLLTGNAIAGESLSFRPPVRFAGAYDGKLSVERLKPRNAIQRCFEMTGKRPKYGCAIRAIDLSWCLVVIPNKIVRRPHGNFMRPREVLRHELGHCNGWPAHHPH